MFHESAALMRPERLRNPTYAENFENLGVADDWPGDPEDPTSRTGDRLCDWGKKLTEECN